MKNKIVFFGTPQFASDVLAYLLQNSIPVCAVVTQPDRPKGRNLQVSASSVKSLVSKLSPEIPVLQPEKASDPQFLDAMRSLEPDLFVVVAYGQILPQALLDIPKKGAINVHASLLPKYRGAAPIQRAMMEQEKKTGVAIQKMVLKMDAGDVIATAKVAIEPHMNRADLEQALISAAQPLLVKVIQEYAEKVPQGTPQDHAQASYAPKIEPEDGLIHWEASNEQIDCLIRALSPRPGAWCWVFSPSGKKRLKILRAKPVLKKGVAGQMVEDGVIACGIGALELVEVQPEGKKVMPARDWLRGQQNILFTE